MYIFTNVLKLMMVYVFLRYLIYARDYYFLLQITCLT